MAYDPVKSHEYYVNYRKKGLKKGRKKGTAKASKPRATTLVGLSVVGLNDAGKVEAGLIRERLKAEMNNKLASASDAEKEQIRADYSRRAMQEIAALKSDSKYAKSSKAKTTKATTVGSGSKGGSSKGEKAEKAPTGGKNAGGKAKSTPTVSKKTLASLRTQINSLRQLALTATAPQKLRMKTIINNLLRTLNTLK